MGLVQLHMQPEKKQVRFWIYTLFTINVDLNDEPGVRRWFDEVLRGVKHIHYAIGQVERCPQTQTLHLQLYCEYGRSVHGRFLFKQLGLDRGAGHFEGRRGSQAQCIEYCSKVRTSSTRVI